MMMSTSNRFTPHGQQIQFTTFALSRDMKFCFIARLRKCGWGGRQGRDCLVMRASGEDGRVDDLSGCYYFAHGNQLDVEAAYGDKFIYWL